MKKRFPLVLSLVVMVSILLTACGAGGTPAPAATEPPASGEKVEIRFWGHQAPAFNEANQAKFDEFMAQNPNVTIKYETFPWDVFIQTIQTSLPAGNTADVILIPEIPYRLERIAAKIEALKKNGRNFALIVVAEAVETGPDRD